MEEALKAIVGEDLAAAEEACSFVEDLICNKKDYEAISIVRQASVAYTNDATVIMRFARIFCKVCSFGDDEFSSCEEAGAVGAVVSLCTTDDILMQMNAIQLLSSFGDTQRGLEYLCSQGVLAWLVSTASGEALSPATVHQLPLVANPDSIIRTESMRVLGTIFTKAADRKFDILRKMGMNIVSHFLWTVKKHFEEGSEEERLAGMGTLADFSIISIETLQLVLEGSTAVSGLQGTALLDAWMDLLANSKAEIVSALLQSVAFILSREDAKFLTGTESGERDHVVALKRQLVSRIGQARRTTTVAYLVKLATQPVEATRYAAINLMRALADQQSGWGLQLLFAHAQAATPDGNFYMYLQERLTEYCKEGKDWKFSLITSVWQCPAKSHLPADVNKRLDELVAQGAYYLPPMMDVQTAEA